jgi:hypothetical protein
VTVIAIATVVAWRTIAAYKSETLDASIDQLLLDDDAYFYMTARKFGQEDLPQMLSNGRSVKVINEIGELPEARADSKCREIFSDLFDRQAAAIRRSLKHLEDPSAPKNDQSMLSSKLAVGTAMMATALHGTTTTLMSQFSTLDEFRDEIDRRLTANAELYPPHLPIAFATRHNYVPDNRFQLNVLCIHAARIGGAPAEKAMEIGARLRKSSIPVVSRRPNRTWFDIPPRLEGVPIGQSDGRTAYVLYDWLSDAWLDDHFQRRTLDELRKSIEATVDADRADDR